MKIKYFLHARKSTEPEERQTMSIPSQIKELKQKFPDLEIVDVIEEKHSAYHPYQRPVFENMLDRIRKGEAQGLIDWHPDRLSRNEVDAAAIVYLLRTGQLQDLKFGSYYFDNSPEGIMMLQIALSQSQYYSSKLSKDVKRGNRQKYSLGGITWKPPQGYMHDVINHTIVEDPERFPLVEKMWEMLLSGNYSVLEICRIANEEWGYRTRKTKKEGGNPLAPSTLYRSFRNTLYYGVNIRPDGTVHECTHRKMITEEQFWLGQAILGKRGRPRPHTHQFSYTQLIKCGECNGWVTAEEKYKKNKTDSRIRHYIYYHCTKRKAGIKCSQPCIEIKELERQIDEILSHLAISEKFKNWALKYLKLAHQKEMKDQGHINVSQQKRFNDIHNELDRLLDMRLRELVTEEEYHTKKQKLLIEQASIEERLKDNKHRTENWLELAEKTFDFACHARSRFQNGTLEDKRIILQTIGGSNLVLKDKQLIIEPNELLSILINRTENSTWQGRRESNPHHRFWRPMFYH